MLEDNEANIYERRKNIGYNVVVMILTTICEYDIVCQERLEYLRCTCHTYDSRLFYVAQRQ